MAEKVLQVNFRFSVSRAAYEQEVSGLADAFAVVPGCRWKIWLINEAENEAGGIYLFDNDAAIDAMLNGELIAGVLAHPALSDFSVKRFDVLPGASAVTRAPLHGLAIAPLDNSATRAQAAH